MTKPYAVFFDLDDTLYDQLAPYRLAVEHVLGEEAVKELDMDALYYKFRHYSDVLWGPYLSGELPLTEMRIRRAAMALADFGIMIRDETALLIQQQYEAEQGRIELHPGVRECFAALEREGCLLGIITNGPHEHQQKKLEALRLPELIDPSRIFISGAVGMAKPDPALFAYVNEQTSTSAERCCYIGDSWANDVVGAAGAGWSAIWFNPRGLPMPEGGSPRAVAKSYEGLADTILHLSISS